MNIEEGMLCPICNNGRMEFVPNGECSCHIIPPCNACVESYLKCSGCGITEDELQQGNKWIVPATQDLETK